MSPSRKATVDAAYEAYDRHPLDEPDQRGIWCPSARPTS